MPPNDDVSIGIFIKYYFSKIYFKADLFDICFFNSLEFRTKSSNSRTAKSTWAVDIKLYDLIDIFGSTDQSLVQFMLLIFQILNPFERKWSTTDRSAMMDTSNDGLSALPQIKEDRWMIGNH